MAEKKKSTKGGKGKKGSAAPRKAAAGGGGSDRVRVLVEVRVPDVEAPEAMLSMAAPALDVEGFRLDSDWQPVPLPPPEDMAASLEAAHERTALVRGTVTADEREALEAQDRVVKVWDDSPIAPFQRTGQRTGLPAGGYEAEDSFVQPVESAAMAACPIPPCDCAPGTAKGDLAAVRSYLGVDQIWADGIRGTGIVVGVVDGGITTPTRVAGGKIPNVIGGAKADWGQKALWDGHGEMCATDVLGMASDARLYDLRLPDGSDTIGALLSDAIAAFQWAITRHQADGTPHILTNSWGIFQESWDPAYATDPNHPFTRKVVDALNEGILVLFAAGNCGGTCPDGRCGPDNGPGRSIWGANGHPRVMTVGAANIHDELIGYSSQGPAALDPHKPDFCSISHFEGYFASDSGTSAATPIAAGVVALLEQKGKSVGIPLTQDRAKEALKRTAKDIGAGGWDQHSGSGVIHAKKAHDFLYPVTTPCERERENASRCLAAYRRTGERRSYCCYLYWGAMFYLCQYRRTGNRRYLCLYYLWASRYLYCRYQETRDRRFYDAYERHHDAYRRCR
jgi:serine protease AprX